MHVKQSAERYFDIFKFAFMGKFLQLHRFVLLLLLLAERYLKGTLVPCGTRKLLRVPGER